MSNKVFIVQKIDIPNLHQQHLSIKSDPILQQQHSPLLSPSHLMKHIFNSLSKTNSSHSKSPPRKSSSEPTKQKRLNTIITTLFLLNQKQNQKTSTPSLDQTLIQLAELLVWAEKHNNSLFWQIDDMNIFNELFISIFQQNKLSTLQCLILLLTNIKTQYYVQKLIVSPTVHHILSQHEFNEEENSYLINLLKSIGQRVTATNCQLLLQEEHSLFLEKCVKLANNQDDMIRTSATNIILNIMNFQSTIISFIFSHPTFIQFYFNITQRFVTQISSFNQKVISGNISVNEINRELMELDDTLILIQDLSSVKSYEARTMISNVFYHDIMLSYILPCFNIKIHSTLSLKFGLFLLVKLLPILIKINYHNQILKLLFSINSETISNTCWYNQKLSLIEKLSVFLCVNTGKKPDTVPYSLESARENIITYLKCKDDNIIYLLSYLLIEVIRSKQFDRDSLIECGLFFDEENQNTRVTKRLLLGILMKQIKPPFRVITIKNVAILVMKFAQRINENSFVMDKGEIELFQSVYRQSIEEIELYFDTLSILKAIEYFQYDSKYIEIKGFELKHKIGKQSFMIPGEQNKHLNFYQRCPITTQQCLRLDLFIFGILRKMRYIIFPSKLLLSHQNTLFSKLYQPRISNQQNFKPGEMVQKQQKTLKCKMLSNSIWISCCILNDRMNLIIVAEEHVTSRVIINLKFKYLGFEYESKTDSSKIVVKVKGYNMGSQDFVYNDDIFVKGENTIMSQWIMSELQTRVKEVKKGEVEFLKKYLKQSKEDGVLIDHK